MNTKVNTILALGADMKSRYCVLKNNRLILSEDFGNLGEFDNFKKFEKSIRRTNYTFKTVAFDMHPGYFSSRISDSLKVRNKVAVQHHHAHIASILAANKTEGPVIGVAFDGTGYGIDGNIWGGEFMIVDGAEFQRVAHFNYLGMPGGEKAVEEPWRMAFSLIYRYLGEDVFKQDLELLKLYSEDRYDLMVKMLKNNINSPLTSSVGRLFDAVSSILGICHKVKYEAQAAIELEQLATKSQASSFYNFDLIEKEGILRVSHLNLVNGLLLDLKNGLPKEDIARKFHNSLVVLTVKIINRISHEHKIRDVVLSGGVFVNKLLFNSIKQKLEDSGYNLLVNTEAPVNDLGICLGQAYIASRIK